MIMSDKILCFYHNLVKRQVAEREKEKRMAVDVYVCPLSLISRICDDASSTHNTQKRSNNKHTLVRKETVSIVLLFYFYFSLLI